MDVNQAIVKILEESGRVRHVFGSTGQVNASMLLASWGRNVPDKNAPDLVEGVGIGVKVPLQYVVTTLETDIDYLAVLQPVNHHISYTLSVCSLREKDGPKTAEDWFNLLRK